MRVSKKQHVRIIKELEARVSELDQRLDIRREMTRNLNRQIRLLSEIINNSNL